MQDLTRSTLFAMISKRLVVDGLRLTSNVNQMGYMKPLTMTEKKANLQQMKFPNLEKHQRLEMTLYVIGLVLARDLLSKDVMKQLRGTKF